MVTESSVWVQQSCFHRIHLAKLQPFIDLIRIFSQPNHTIISDGHAAEIALSSLDISSIVPQTARILTSTIRERLLCANESITVDVHVCVLGCGKAGITVMACIRALSQSQLHNYYSRHYDFTIHQLKPVAIYIHAVDYDSKHSNCCNNNPIHMQIRIFIVMLEMLKNCTRE